MNPKRAIYSLAAVSVLILAGLVSSATGQQPEEEIPVLSAGAMPIYPRTALLVHIQGIVKLKVSTDGERASSVDVQSGPPMLAKAAKENILTWQFDRHKPTTFVTTFEYVITRPAQCEITNSASVLKPPLKMQVTAEGVQTCDPAEKIKPQK